nr:MAG TPA: hypothetical protein [Caudoviricetes sp.]
MSGVTGQGKAFRCAWVQIPACHKFSQNKIPKGESD